MNHRPFGILLSLLLLLPGLRAEAHPSARVYLTAKATGERLADKGSVPFQTVAQPDENTPTVIVDPAHSFQTIEGIGGAVTDAAAETLAKLPAARQAELVRAYYDPTAGIGYSLARTHINSCDFSSSSYTYVKDGDASLDSFDLAPDRRLRIPLLQRILKTAPQMKVFASPWSPPAWMKTNNDVLHGGKLKPQFADAWARYYVRFVKGYAAEGIPIWGLTVQNEPMAAQTWESCLFTGEEERDFIKGHLGPVLQSSGLGGVKLMHWDHNRGLLYQRASTVLSDPEAARYVWGTAYHWYDGDLFENIGKVHDAFPDKALFFSEGCNYPFRWEAIDDWKWGEKYGFSMINDFNQWACGWTDWNILLDETGGPNHVGNFCFAPVHADTRDGSLHFTSGYYYIGHFSKWVRPGAHRIACTSVMKTLSATAFRNPDGSTATVVMNREDKDQDARIWSAGRMAVVHLPSHSIATVLW